MQITVCMSLRNVEEMRKKLVKVRELVGAKKTCFLLLSLSAEGDVTYFLHEILKIRTNIFNINIFPNSLMK